MHTLTVGVVLDVRDTLNPLVLNKVRDIFNKPCLVNLVRQLAYDNFKSAVLCFDNLGLCADGDFALTCGVGGSDSASAHDNSACRKVRTGNTFHKLGQLDVGVVNIRAGGVDSLTEIMRRNFGRHTNGDTA